MFTSDYRFYGKHALMTDELLAENGGIFDTVYDVLFSAAIVGFLSQGTSSEEGSRTDTKTIFSDKLQREFDKSDFIVRTLLLANPYLDGVKENSGRVELALRHFNQPDTEKANSAYFKGYALRGIEVLHEEFVSKKQNTDAVTIIQEMLANYIQNAAEYTSMYDFILDISK